MPIAYHGGLELIERLNFQSDQHSDMEDRPVRLFSPSQSGGHARFDKANSKVAVPMSLSLGSHTGSFDCCCAVQQRDYVPCCVF